MAVFHGYLIYNYASPYGLWFPALRVPNLRNRIRVSAKGWFWCPKASKRHFLAFFRGLVTSISNVEASTFNIETTKLNVVATKQSFEATGLNIVATKPNVVATARGFVATKLDVVATGRRIEATKLQVEATA